MGRTSHAPADAWSNMPCRKTGAHFRIKVEPGALGRIVVQRAEEGEALETLFDLPVVEWETVVRATRKATDRAYCMYRQGCAP